jgi:hypothetical protein
LSGRAVEAFDAFKDGVAQVGRPDPAASMSMITLVKDLIRWERWKTSISPYRGKVMLGRKRVASDLGALFDEASANDLVWNCLHFS